ncbi:hypothetical protein [Pseudomonas sp. IT-P12]|uniref:hypothetical protein n=1 Tax=Pseudomonas sp. IT-P12 TaxID=3026450 RepID=UPI0039E1D366
MNYFPHTTLNRLSDNCYSMVVISAQGKEMVSIDDFRVESHRLLLELDAATMGMMQLVSSRVVSGPDWDVASRRQHDAYACWDAFMNAPLVPAAKNFPPAS